MNRDTFYEIKKIVEDSCGHGLRKYLDDLYATIFFEPGEFDRCEKSFDVSGEWPTIFLKHRVIRFGHLDLSAGIVSPEHWSAVKDRIDFSLFDHKSNQ